MDRDSSTHGHHESVRPGGYRSRARAHGLICLSDPVWQSGPGEGHHHVRIIQHLCTEADTSKPVTMFGPDFPFAFDDWIRHPSGLGSVPAHRHGQEVAIIGAGMAGMTAAFELMKMGLKP